MGDLWATYGKDREMVGRWQGDGEIAFLMGIVTNKTITNNFVTNRFVSCFFVVLLRLET